MRDVCVFFPLAIKCDHHPLVRKIETRACCRSRSGEWTRLSPFRVHGYLLSAWCSGPGIVCKQGGDSREQNREPLLWGSCHVCV